MPHYPGWILSAATSMHVPVGRKQLARAQPREIPALLPGLLSCIRMIWNLSKFYNTEERLTGLLRKISNQVKEQRRHNGAIGSDLRFEVQGDA